PGDGGDRLLLFGSGTYRASDVTLAATTLDAIEDADALRYFAGVDPVTGTPRWTPLESEARPLLDQACVGELSAAWSPALGAYLLAYNCDAPRGIQARAALRPWGPWGPVALVFEPWR